jgi:hypothetical protein
MHVRFARFNMENRIPTELDRELKESFSVLLPPMLPGFDGGGGVVGCVSSEDGLDIVCEGERFDEVPANSVPQEMKMLKINDTSIRVIR